MSDHNRGSVLCHILALLPVASLLRFRCVCKFINRLIDSSSFIEDHLALQNPRFIAMYNMREFLVPSSHTLESSMISSLLTPHPESRRINIIGTLHGIVCFHFAESHIMLSNFSIRKSLILPLPDQTDLDRSAFEFVPDYPEDDYWSTLFTGFWIDYSTKEFKIIMLKMWFRKLSSIRDAVLFSSTERRWRLVSAAKTGKYENRTNPAVIIRGMGYWRSTDVRYRDEDGVYCWFTRVIILSFDFEDEDFCTFDAPEVGFVLNHLPMLYRMQDSLSIMYVDRNNSAVIYTRRSDSWISIYNFQVAAPVMNMLTVLNEVEEKGKEGLPEENIGILGITSTRDLVICKPGTDSIIHNLRRDFEYPFQFTVAIDFVSSLLFPC